MKRTTTHLRLERTMIATALVLAAAGALAAAADCPAAVTDAIERAHPGSRIESCAEEREGGVLAVEAMVTTARGNRIEIELTPDGAILATEEQIALAAIPPAVLAAFERAHPGAHPTGAERGVMADGTTIYEIEFGRFEAAFREDGASYAETGEDDGGGEDE